MVETTPKTERGQRLAVAALLLVVFILGVGTLGLVLSGYAWI